MDEVLPGGEGMGGGEYAKLYDGVIEGSWLPGVQALARSVGAAAAGVTFRGADGSVAQEWVGLDEAFNAAYVSHYHAYDPWFRELTDGRSGVVVAEGHAYLSRDIVTPKVLAKNAVVQELHRTSGLGDLQFAMLVGPGEHVVSLGLMRPHDAAPFDTAERDTVERAIPHFQRALRIAALRRRASAAPSIGSFWVDAHGRVIDLDSGARAILSADDGVRLVGNRLLLHRPSDDRALRAALLDRGKTAFLCAARRSERRAYLLALKRDGNAMRLQIHDRDVVAEPIVEALCRWFGVTWTEAGLMISLAQGKAPSELASERGVTIATIRTQLSSIYAKTGTRRQAELAVLVERLVLLG